MVGSSFCLKATFLCAGLAILDAMRAIRCCSHKDVFEMKLMGCLRSSFINYRLLSLRGAAD